MFVTGATHPFPVIWTDAIEAVVLVLATAIFVFAIRRLRSREPWRRATPGLVASWLALLGFVGAYLWLFSRGPCSSRLQLACTLNANDGFLTFLAVVFAGIGVWTAALAHWAAERHAEEQAREGARQALSSATDECEHNLIHVATAWTERGWQGWMPQLTVSAVPVLLDPEYRKYYTPRLVAQADAVNRNWQPLRDIPPLADVTSEDDPSDPPPRLPDFVSRSVLLLVYALTDHRSWCSERLMTPVLRPLFDAAAWGGQVKWTSFTSKIDRDEEADLRVNGVAVCCWRKDRDIRDVTIFELGSAFEDLARGHHHD